MAARSCDWPACDRRATDSVELVPGVRVIVGGEQVEASSFSVCKEHAPAFGRMLQDALDTALRKHRARTNLAPGDAEWQEYFGDE